MSFFSLGQYERFPHGKTPPIKCSNLGIHSFTYWICQDHKMSAEESCRMPPAPKWGNVCYRPLGGHGCSRPLSSKDSTTQLQKQDMELHVCCLYCWVSVLLWPSPSLLCLISSFWSRSVTSVPFHIRTT